MTLEVRWSRDALDDLKAQIAFIATGNPGAAQRVADRIRAACAALGEMPTGRPGRVSGTYEKSSTRLPYTVAYALAGTGGREVVSILRVIHAARHWPDDGWPGQPPQCPQPALRISCSREAVRANSKAPSPAT